MGRLIDQERRRKARAERLDRQTAIRDAARKTLLSRPVSELSLEALDRAAGLRQGAASMYFGSVEELVTGLLREELSDWLHDLATALEASPGPLGGHDMAAILAGTILERRLLCRLLAGLPALAGLRSSGMDRILDFETWRMERLRETGTLLESRLPEMGPGGGVVLLRRTVLLAAALEPLLNPPPGLVLAMNDPELAPLYPDVHRELHSLLAALLGDTGAGNAPDRS